MGMNGRGYGGGMEVRAYRFPECVDHGAAAHLVGRWGRDLAIMGAELEDVGIRMEAEFLRTGSMLEDFHRRTVNIQSMSAAAAGLLRGGEIRAAIGGLKEVLDTVQANMASSERDIEGFIGNFSRILETVRVMKERLGSIDSVCRSLRKHSTTMKIYSAQLAIAGADFGPLADDVKKLSEIMEVRTSGISAELDVLGSHVSQVTEDIRRLGEKHRTETGDILRRIKASVASLNRKHEAAASVSLELKDMAQEISGMMGDIVSSLQFHDVTNQQIERARATIGKLRMLLEAQAEGDGHVAERSGLLEAINLAGFACGIQSEHLCRAGGDFSAAVNRVAAGLRGIADRVSAISGRVLETSLESGGSFLDDIKSGLTAVSAAFFEIVENKKQFERAAQSAARIERKIASFMGDIESIGEDINIIALNASVKAAQIGEKGAVLGVIANSMQRVLMEAQGLTDAAVACRLSLTATGAEGGDVEAVTQNLQSLLRSINRVNEDLSEIVESLSGESRALSEDMRAAANSLPAHEALWGPVGRVVAGLEGVFKGCESFFPADHFRLKEVDIDLLEAQLVGVGGEAGFLSCGDMHTSYLHRVHEQGGTVEFF